MLEVRLIASTIVPQLSELEVLAEITEDFKDGECWLMEQRQGKLQVSLCIAQSPVCPQGNKVVIRLLNPSSEPVSV